MIRHMVRLVVQVVAPIWMTLQIGYVGNYLTYDCKPAALAIGGEPTADVFVTVITAGIYYSYYDCDPHLFEMDPPAHYGFTADSIAYTY